mgnify:CR=1 FL=1
MRKGNYSVGGVLFFFVETIVHQCFDGLHGILFVIAFDAECQFGADAGCQHHNRHNAFAVYLTPFLRDLYVAGEAAGYTGEFRGSTGVKTQFVDDFQFLFDHVVKSVTSVHDGGHGHYP